MAYALWGVTAMLFFFGQSVQAAVHTALENCLFVLVPAMFPSMVLSLCLVRVSGSPPQVFLKIFRFLGLPDATVYPWVLGLTGGYCTGAKLAFACYSEGKLSEQQAKAALSFCVNPAFGFVVGVLGAEAKRLYGFLMLCSLIVGTASCRRESADFHDDTSCSIGMVFKDALGEAVSAMSSVIGATLFFSAVCACVPEGFVLFGLDVTTDLLYLRRHMFALRMPLSAFVMAFGGLNVFLQVRMLCPAASAQYLSGALMKGVLLMVAAIVAQKKGTVVAVAFLIVLWAFVIAVKRAALRRERHCSGTISDPAHHSIPDSCRRQK